VSGSRERQATGQDYRLWGDWSVHVRARQVYVAIPGPDVLERNGTTIVEVMNDLGREGWGLVTSSAGAGVREPETYTFRRVAN
jgi:hypothetical protein